MKKTTFLDGIGYVDGDLIEKAESDGKRSRRNILLRWGSLAACLCLITGAAIFIPSGLRRAGDDVIAEERAEDKGALTSAFQAEAPAEAEEMPEEGIITQEINVTQPPTETADIAGVEADEAIVPDIDVDIEHEDLPTDETRTDNVVPSTGVGIPSSDVEDAITFFWRMKLNVRGSLYWALEKDPDAVYTVAAVYRPVTSEITDFVFEGKTLADWAIASYDAKLLPDKMMQLLKCGDVLKYGTMVYETGVPPYGEKWDRNLYEEQVAFFGDLLDRYIVDGEFLEAKLKEDIEAVKDGTSAVMAEADEQYRRAFNAYLCTYMPGVVNGPLLAYGVPCWWSEDTSNTIFLEVNAEQLENLPLDNIGYWSFGLAVSENTGGQSDPADD
ncbi:MAG: hypothetical protein MJ175_01875 [Clostridia bacterium]|nr:hypothetical protein [Clostridia bacterium]